MGVAAPVPWVPAYAGTTGKGVWHVYRGCGRVGVAAPVPWVPAFAGTGYGVTILRRYDGGGVLNAQLFGQFT